MGIDYRRFLDKLNLTSGTAHQGGVTPVGSIRDILPGRYFYQPPVTQTGPTGGTFSLITLVPEPGFYEVWFELSAVTAIAGGKVGSARIRNESGGPMAVWPFVFPAAISQRWSLYLANVYIKEAASSSGLAAWNLQLLDETGLAAGESVRVGITARSLFDA